MSTKEDTIKKEKEEEQCLVEDCIFRAEYLDTNCGALNVTVYDESCGRHIPE